MRSRRILLIPAVLALLTLAARDAAASVILDTTTTFTSSGTQFGRLFRDGVPTDWANPAVFPGVTGAPVARAYETFAVNSGAYSYLQILLDDPLTVLFASAYLGSYAPVNIGPNYGLNVNYLGDAGVSQPFGNPAFFNIVVAPFTNVVIVVNEVNPGGGAQTPFNLLVEGFYDTEYHDAENPPTTPVPEPASLALFGSGTALLAAWRRRRAQ